jgi:hypothetical protein
VSRLLIVASDRPVFFQDARARYAGQDVQVIMDRRRAERRAQGTVRVLERRRTERRRTGDGEAKLRAVGYVMVSTARDPGGPR